MRSVSAGLIAATFLIGTPAAAAGPWGDAQPLTERALSTITGRAAPTTRLSAFTSEISAVQGQLVAENLRTAFDVWFADNNVQLAANAGLLR